MIVIFVVVIIVWYLMGDCDKNKPISLLSVGLIITYIIAVMANAPPGTDIPLGNNEAIRVSPQIAYPFSIHQYRDYEAGLFSYAITIGGPQGPVIVQYELMDDQSLLIKIQSYSAGLTVGLILLVGMASFVVGLILLDQSKKLPAKKERFSPIVILIMFQLALIFFMFPLLGSLYPWGGLIVFIITIIPVISAIRNGEWPEEVGEWGPTIKIDTDDTATRNDRR